VVWLELELESRRPRPTRLDDDPLNAICQALTHATGC
jgi:hypothetical protein